MNEYHYEVGDIVKLKKPHPCGSNEWEILRVGADFRLKCMGCEEAYSSFSGYYAGDWLVNLTLMALIVIGGLGFVVWADVSFKKFKWKAFSLHTKLVLSVTVILIVMGAFLLFLFEQGNTLAVYLKQKNESSVWS